MQAESPPLHKQHPDAPYQDCTPLVQEILILIRDAKQSWKKAVSTTKLELISKIAFNSIKQSFALKNFRPILTFLCSN